MLEAQVAAEVHSNVSMGAYWQALSMCRLDLQLVKVALLDDVGVEPDLLDTATLGWCWWGRNLRSQCRIQQDGG